MKPTRACEADARRSAATKNHTTQMVAIFAMPSRMMVDCRRSSAFRVFLPSPKRGGLEILIPPNWRERGSKSASARFLNLPDNGRPTDSLRRSKARRIANMRGYGRAADGLTVQRPALRFDPYPARGSGRRKLERQQRGEKNRDLYQDVSPHKDPPGSARPQSGIAPTFRPGSSRPSCDAHVNWQRGDAIGCAFQHSVLWSRAKTRYISSC